MESVGYVWEFGSSLLIFAFGFFILHWVGKKLNASKTRISFIYFWHTLFCILYVAYAEVNSADALDYYAQALNGEFIPSFGTGAVVSIAIPFVVGLNLSFLGVCLVFNILGSLGLLAFDASLRVATKYKSPNIHRLATLIILLPSVSFWSSAIGKDSLSFMAVGLGMWAALNLKRRVWLMVVAVLVMLIVRPHIAGLMVLALAGATIFQKKVSFIYRLGLGGVSLGAAALLVPLALDYVGVGVGANAEDLIAYAEGRQGYNQQGGGSIDIATMSPPMQLFAYLFRPLPFEAHTLFALAASLDNLILLFMFTAGGWQMLKRRVRMGGENRAFMWIYALLAWTILAITTANLGISVRQKWMFVPMLVFLFISVMGKPRRLSKRTQLTAPHVVTHEHLNGKPSA